jgi:hypothetical protein|tara:strand:+ start:36 stop:542 length:507 start_codon:yes stop_codon:yes gene_type:complete
MIEERTIKVYEYNDLNEKAKEKALNWFRENNNYDFLSDDLEEDLKELLRVNKISFDESLKIYYSLSYSQGDGFCFEGDFEYKDYQINIKNSGHYSHKNSVNIEITKEDGEDAKEEIYKEFKNIFDDICDELEKIGYSYIESENSEENFRDWSNANDYRFLEDGSFWKF